MSTDDARRLAIDALTRIDDAGAYANLLVPELLTRSDLDERDRGFVTELVYGTTRMRRACDALVDPFVLREVEPRVRSALRVGAYQLHFLDTPPHAAVSATVAAVPKRARGFVNAILRRVADQGQLPDDPAIRLSYPDWIVDRLDTDLAPLGPDAAREALAHMNRSATVSVRDDGYRQDPSSQLVAGLVTEAGLVVDLCAAPGGKATALSQPDRFVVASDVRQSRAGLVAANVVSTGATGVATVVADGRAAPLVPGCADAVLVDAPCSGLGALRRRPDARWRIDSDAVDRLHALQVELLHAAADLVRPGGQVVYSVCTLTAAESLAVDDRIRQSSGLVIDEAVSFDAPWVPWGRGGLLLPQAIDSDGMVALVYRRGHG
ncbi:MAG: transcription antitermination factor NusB [Acidimicrobiales bacterium]